MCVMCAMAYMWRPENNVQLAISFHHVGPEEQMNKQVLEVPFPTGYLLPPMPSFSNLQSSLPNFVIFMAL